MEIEEREEHAEREYIERMKWTNWEKFLPNET